VTAWRVIARQALTTLRSSGSEARQALRVMVGTALAFAVYRAFDMPQGYWAVFTVVIVMQGSIGGTLSASIDRAKGTALGAAVGAAAALLHPHTPVGLGAAMTVAVGITAYAASLYPSLKVAPVTAVIMLITPQGVAISPLESAAFRVLEIVIGGVVGVLAMVLIFPARSTALVVAKVQAILDLMAEVMEGYAASMAGAAQAAPDTTPGGDVQLRIRTGLAAVEAAMADADRERSTRLGAHRLSDALPRTLWRVRNDGVSVSRALAPLPEVVAAVIGPAVTALMRAEAAFMRRCGEALAAGGRVDRGERDLALAAFETAMADLRRSGVTHDLDFDAVGHVFGLAFALESLHRNLTDLADRIDEAMTAPTL